MPCKLARDSEDIMHSSQPKDLISVTGARKLLGVSRIKMAELLKNKVISHYPYPIDRRVKLVSKAAVMALKNTRVSSDSDASANFHPRRRAA